MQLIDHQENEKAYLFTINLLTINKILNFFAFPLIWDRHDHIVKRINIQPYLMMPSRFFIKPLDRLMTS